jgi:putative oxidoreductase
MTMLQPKHRALLLDKGTLVGRSLIGLFFVFSAYSMLMGGAEATAGYYGSVGVPMAGLAYYLVLAVKLLGGFGLILGYRLGCAALSLIVFTLLATYFGHSDTSDPMNQIAIMKNLAIVGGLLYVAAFGAGTGWRLKA